MSQLLHLPVAPATSRSDWPGGQADSAPGQTSTSDMRNGLSPPRAGRIETQNFVSGKSVNSDSMVGGPRAGRRPGFMEAALIVLWGGIQVALGLAWIHQPTGDTAGSTVTRCDRMAQVISSRNHAIRDAQWRRERESEFAACLEGPDTYARSRGIQ